MGHNTCKVTNKTAQLCDALTWNGLCWWITPQPKIKHSSPRQDETNRLLLVPTNVFHNTSNVIFHWHDVRHSLVNSTLLRHSKSGSIHQSEGPILSTYLHNSQGWERGTFPPLSVGRVLIIWHNKEVNQPATPGSNYRILTITLVVSSGKHTRIGLVSVCQSVCLSVLWVV